MQLSGMSQSEVEIAVSRVVTEALDCKARGDLHGALQCFRTALAQKHGFEFGGRVTAMLNITSVLNGLNKHQMALEQAISVLTELKQECPLLSIVSSSGRSSIPRRESDSH